MAQIFPRKANVHAKVMIVAVVVALGGAIGLTYALFWSPYTTYVDVPINQPVPFSHKHHVGDDGIDCRYCHTSVEKSSFAGIPSTQICMTCHSQIWTEAPVLQPVRASLTANRPLQWNRVNDLPDFVFFNHSIHIAKGVGCSTCHGRTRPDAAHLADADPLHEMVPPVPSRSAKLRATARTKFTTCIGNRRPIRKNRACDSSGNTASTRPAA